MNCPNCGFLLPDDSSFCQYCGTVLPRNAPENEPAHAAQPSTQPDARAAAAFPAAIASPTAAPSPAAVPSPTAAPSPAAVPSPTAAPSPAAVPDTGDPGSAAQQRHKGKRTKQCKACGADIDPRAKKCTVCGKPASRVQPAALILAAVSVLLVCSLVGNLFQYRSAARIQQELESSSATITEQESAIFRLENQLDWTKTRLEQAQKKADNYDLIYNFLLKSDAGYASDQFFASKSVLVLNRAGGDQTFFLTTGFSGGGQISFSTSGTSAAVSFTEDSWHDRTPIRVSPKSTGATYITFSNTLNSQTFRVLGIVI